MFSVALSLLSALPLALAAPTCTLQTSAAIASPTPSSAPSNPSSSNTTTGAGTNSTNGISMAWFADWHTDFGVSDISWAGYTHMAFFT